MFGSSRADAGSSGQAGEEVDAATGEDVPDSFWDVGAKRERWGGVALLDLSPLLRRVA